MNSYKKNFPLLERRNKFYSIRHEFEEASGREMPLEVPTKDRSSPKQGQYIPV